MHCCQTMTRKRGRRGGGERVRERERERGGGGQRKLAVFLIQPYKEHLENIRA